MTNIEAEETTVGPNSRRLKQAGWAAAAGMTTEVIGVIMENPYAAVGGIVVAVAGVAVAYVELGSELGLRQERPRASEPNS